MTSDHGLTIGPSVWHPTPANVAVGLPSSHQGPPVRIRVWLYG